MRLSLSSLVRMIALLGIGSTFLAVGVARAVPKAPMPVRGVEASPRYYGVNGVVFTPHKEANFLLDSETGELREFALPKNVAFDYATCSPWRDERGDYELVGRITERSGEAAGKLCEGWAMARIRVQSREVVKRTPMNLLVAGSPCWLAGRPARVVFPGGNGCLYVQDLGDDDESDDDAGTPPERRIVAWNAQESGVDRAILNDPVRPVVPEIGGRLFVALNPSVRKGQELSFARSQIWWITLSADGRSIEAAGRLITPEFPTSDDDTNEERLPNLVATPDGRIALAYLRRKAGVPTWSLCVAPVNADPKTGVPTVSASEVRSITSDCAVTIPAFSSDGRWLYHVPRDIAWGERVPRFSVVDALARR